MAAERAAAMPANGETRNSGAENKEMATATIDDMLTNLDTKLEP